MVNTVVQGTARDSALPTDRLMVDETGPVTLGQYANQCRGSSKTRTYQGMGDIGHELKQDEEPNPLGQEQHDKTLSQKILDILSLTI